MGFTELQEKILSKNLIVCVIGLGYTGLPLAIDMVRAGFNVIGIDNDKGKIKDLEQGVSYIDDITNQEIKEIMGSKRFKPTDNYSKIKQADIVSICVPTPLSKTKSPDLSYIKDVVEKIKRYIHKDLLIILESTIYPGTTEEIILNPVQKLGYNVGTDFFVCFSPERIELGNKRFNIKNTPKIIGGMTNQCSQLAASFYEQIIDKVIVVKSIKAAEMVKLLENAFRTVNIGLVNEMAMMSGKIGIDIWEVIDSAATKPFGFMPFYPGPGTGGDHEPIDSTYVSLKLKDYDSYNRFIDLANYVNENMPYYIINRVSEVLNKYGKTIKDSKILILGIAYKNDVSSTRQSPAIEIYELLNIRGAKVSFNDPYIGKFKDTQENEIYSIEITAKELCSYDLVLIATNHSVYNYDFIQKNSKIIFDTRNAIGNIRANNVFRL